MTYFYLLKYMFYIVCVKYLKQKNVELCSSETNVVLYVNYIQKKMQLCFTFLPDYPVKYFFLLISTYIQNNRIYYTLLQSF